MNYTIVLAIALKWIPTIALIIAIALPFTLYIVAYKKGFTQRRIASILLVLGALFLIYLAFHLFDIEPAAWAEIMLALCLVCVTGFYAFSAFKQTKEMKEQRYDAFRPVIDIVEMSIEPMELAKQAYGAREGKLPNGWPCIFRNIGVGSAIDVFSFIEHHDKGRLPWNFGTLATGEKTERMDFSTKHENNRMALVVHYKDVYGRDFESSREITLNKEGSGWKIDPLEVSKIAKEEAAK